MQPLIKIVNLTKSFDKNIVLDKINLDILPDKIIGIAGRSGAGKTTLLKSIIGCLNIDEGDIYFQIKKKPTALKFLKKERSIFHTFFGFSTQEGSFYENLSVQENLLFYGSLYNKPKEEVQRGADELVSLVGISDKKNTLAKHLSSGMQKRLDIACSLIHNPKIILMDEPTAHLDQENGKNIWKLIKKINKKNTTVILTSHSLKELKEVCHKVYFLHDSKLKKLKGV